MSKPITFGSGRLSTPFSREVNEPQPATVEGESELPNVECARCGASYPVSLPTRHECAAQPTTPHTATPWRVYGKQIQGFPNGNLQRKVIATVTTDAEQDVNDANGNFIVQAVNSFDTRDMALRQAQTIIRDYVNGVERTAWLEVLAVIDAALKKE